jgi:3-deoxy-D-manno-octulosonic-acid transferase
VKFIYSIGIQLYYLGILLYSFYNKKAKKWIDGRKEILPKYKSKNNTYWFHCASLGEFEQGLPLIEYFEKSNTSNHILVTFFSPSGYDIVKKKYTRFDVHYLPLDTPKNAKILIEKIKPTAVFFIKYEFWYHILNEIKKQQIPVYLIAGIFRKNQLFFKPWGVFYRKILQQFTTLFVQDIESKNLLKKINIQHVEVTGDTRFDRVLATSQVEFSDIKIEQFIANRKVFIAGSIWDSDNETIEKIIRVLPKNWCVIIAPHEMLHYNYNWCKNEAVIYTNELDYSASILIINTVGILSKLYSYATISYIGGGFGKGIHNVIESVAFGIPTIIGPTYLKFKEARDLVSLNGIVSIKNSDDLLLIKRLLQDDIFYQKTSTICTNYVSENAGVVEKIVHHLGYK